MQDLAGFMPTGPLALPSMRTTVAARRPSL